MAKNFKLAKEQELRVEVDADTPVTVKLLNGKAEVFGTELALGQTVNITGQKLAIFTWTGCELMVTGNPQSIYESSETPMVTYLNTQDILNRRRLAAQETSSPGPRVIIVGPTDSGKSSLCRILTNYAVRMGWEPMVVDLDLGQGSITCPGSIAACPVQAPVDIEQGYPAENPLAFFYGHLSPDSNPELYKSLVQSLSDLLNRRAERNAEGAAAGMIVNTMGWIDGLGYEILLHSINATKADTVLVVGNEKLYSQLSRHFEGKGTEVVKLKQSGGVVTRPSELRRAARIDKVRDYFYGIRRELAPHSQTVPIADLQGRIYRIGSGPKAPTSALPIGATSVADPLRVNPANIDNQLLHCLLAVSRADKPEALLSSNVAGFVYVSDLDILSGKITYLAPCPGSLPGKYLLAGSFKCYFE